MNQSISKLTQTLRSMLASMALCLLTFSSLQAAEVTAQALTFSDAWVRSSVPGQVNGAGYVKIQNKGSDPDRLLSASSTAATTVELHTVITENGVAKMREIQGLDIPAGKTISMAPGGYHVMFLQIKEPFKEGSVIPVTLKFEKAGSVKVNFVAKPAAYNPAHAGEKSTPPVAHDHAQHHAQHQHAQHSALHHQAPTKQLDPLFISLTTNEPARVSMALSMAQHHSEGGRSITIFLSDKGVLVGLKTSKDQFGEQQNMLNAIMAKGGVVVACPPCMKHLGKTETDLIPGIKMGGPQVTGELLFKEGTRTLSW